MHVHWIINEGGHGSGTMIGSHAQLIGRLMPSEVLSAILNSIGNDCTSMQEVLQNSGIDLTPPPPKKKIVYAENLELKKNPAGITQAGNFETQLIFQARDP